MFLVTLVYLFVAGVFLMWAPWTWLWDGNYFVQLNVRAGLPMECWIYPGGHDMAATHRALSGNAFHPLAEKTVRTYIGRTYRFPEGTPSIVLTDDYNPIDVFDLRLKETIRRGILAGTDADVLI